MFRRTARTLRIGTHFNPEHVGYGNEPVAIRVVTASDLPHEAGVASSLPSLRERLAAADAAFQKHRQHLLDEATGPAITASMDKAAELVGAGHVTEGLDMADFVQRNARGPPRAVSEGLRMLEALALPAVHRHVYSQTGHHLTETLKTLGNTRAAQRAREAEAVYQKVKRAGATAEALRKAYARVMEVHATAGFELCQRNADLLYDRMPAEGVAPTARTYAAVLLSLGLANRMREFDALWGWLSGGGAGGAAGAAPLRLYHAALAGYLEAERFVDVDRLMADMRQRGVAADAAAFDTWVRSIYCFSRHAPGTIPAAEEKRLIFIPAYARKAGVALHDLSEFHRSLVEAAVERWTHEKGVAKTVETMFADKAHEYHAWTEGQRWAHMSHDEMNTSMLEAGVRKMRGDIVNERMRLDVKRGGGRGVIYRPQTHQPITRYDNYVEAELGAAEWSQLGVSRGLAGRTPNLPTPAEAAKHEQLVRRSAAARRSGGGAW